MLFELATVLSLPLFVAVLWVRSYGRPDFIDFDGDGGADGPKDVAARAGMTCGRRRSGVRSAARFLKGFECEAGRIASRRSASDRKPLGLPLHYGSSSRSFWLRWFAARSEEG
jgi:hypothetical protein